MDITKSKKSFMNAINIQTGNREDLTAEEKNFKTV